MIEVNLMKANLDQQQHLCLCLQKAVLGIELPIEGITDSQLQSKSIRGKIRGMKQYGRLVASRNLLILGMSRAGLEPATHWLKASCSTD